MCFKLASIVFIFQFVAPLLKLGTRPTNIAKEFSTSWVLITGVTSDIGMELARRVTQQGVNVIGVGSNVSMLDRSNFLPCQCDMSNTSSVSIIESCMRDHDVGLAIITQDPSNNRTNRTVDFVTAECTTKAMLARSIIINFKRRAKKSSIYLVASSPTPRSGHLWSAAESFTATLGGQLSVEVSNTNVGVCTFHRTDGKPVELSSMADTIMKTLDCNYSVDTLLARVARFLFGDFWRDIKNDR